MHGLVMLLFNSWIQSMLSIRDPGNGWIPCNKITPPSPCRVQNAKKLSQNIAVKQEQRKKPGKGTKGEEEKEKRVSLSYQSRTRAIVSSLLSMMVVVGIVVQRQRSTAPLPSTLTPDHGQRILISSHLACTLRRLIHRRGLPVTIRRRRRLELSVSMVAHILHRVALLRWICRVVLLVVCVVVLLRVGSCSAAARDEPAVVC